MGSLQAQNSYTCSGVATYLSLIQDMHEGELHNMLVFSGATKELVPEVVEKLMELYDFPAAPFPHMGNLVISIPAKWMTVKQLASAVNYTNVGVFRGSPIEAGKQMMGLG